MAIRLVQIEVQRSIARKWSFPCKVALPRPHLRLQMYSSCAHRISKHNVIVETNSVPLILCKVSLYGVRLYNHLVPNVSRQRSVRDSPGKESPHSHVAIEMPTQSLQQLSLMTAAPDTSYLESRSAALQGIESTINELGTIYQQLATMIAEQGEVVQRIDMNVEEMHLNIERGQGELLKYLRSVSSNRWLMIKIFAVLIIFVIFWSVFLI